ncbi:hypothetical protein DESUT3_31330 [Desulfuromonas versatilis]|uniref:NERD domain-containing protein n=2 Tax=Desulfuromonas versatilis TaxID=2802975 RepID=A0ABM8HVP9_9BACT|nr:hypothetical protein DESUT3_31330 [Desulfuromonas versatilis]
MNLLSSDKKIDLINGLSIACKCIFLFLIGLGRYRVCLFLASYFLFKPLLFERIEGGKYLRVLYLVFAIPLLYLDIAHGQIFPIFKSNLIVFFLSFALLELLSKKYINSYVEKITSNEIFSFCKKCGYENIELVNTCKNCQFANKEELPGGKNNSEIGIKFKTDNKNHFSHNPTNRLLKILRIGSSEEVHLNIKIPYIRGIHKNNNKILCKNVIVTNQNIIFIDYKFYHRGWSFQDCLSFSNFKNAEVGIKRVGVSDFPLLKIITNENEKFEFFVSVKNLNQEKYEMLAEEINKLHRKHQQLPLSAN